MPYTREEVVREAEEFLLRRAIRVVLQETPIDDPLQGFTTEQIYEALTPDRRPEGLTADHREILYRLLKRLTPTRLACDPPYLRPERGWIAREREPTTHSSRLINRPK